MKSKLTSKQKANLLSDERQASKRYTRLGYKRLAKDESRHARFIARQPTRLTKRR